MTTATPRRRPAKLLKMADLARESGVPAATIKHYLREGLLPQPRVRTGRNMAYYDPALVGRIRAIKELQTTRFLPLRVIKSVLDEARSPSDVDPLSSAVERVVARHTPQASRTRAQLLASGLPEAQLDFLISLSLVSPTSGPDGEQFGGDDLRLLQTLGEARRAGLSSDMLPVTILEPYASAVRALVELEVALFRKGVLPRAQGDVDQLTEAAMALSEQLLLVLRRKMLLATLHAPPPPAAPRTDRPSRPPPRPSRSNKRPPR